MKFKARIASTVALTLVAFLSACGAGDTGALTEQNGRTAVQVGLIPTASFFPIYVAEEHGFFEDEGLDVDVQVTSNASSVVPSVLNGQMQFGTAATPPFLVAYEKKLPVRAVVNAAGVAAADPEDTGGFLVGKDSSIDSVEDLVGKKVATNQLGSLPHVAATAILSKAGIDPKKVNFVTMPFPEMLGALKQRRVDALLTVEPFMTEAIEAGAAKNLSALYTRVYEPGTTYTLVFSSQEFIEANPEVVAAFSRAVGKANELVAQNPEVLRETLVEYGGMAEELASSVNLGEFRDGFTVEAMQDMADQMREDGFLQSPVDVSTAIWDEE
jgi:NitT/TauT family transport system substrate-binding protein